MSDSRKPAWKKTDNKPRETRLRPLEVIVIDNDVDQAIKVLRHKMSKDGLLTELKRRRFAEKPSEKRRRKLREAVKKMRRARNKRQKAQNRRRKTNKPKK
jgi:small subunit ribosomal protein S21